MKSREYDWANQHLTGMALAGVLRALEEIPDHMMPHVQLDSQSPWALVIAVPGPQFAVWLATGAVYEITDGAVGEEPIATIQEVNQNSQVS